MTGMQQVWLYVAIVALGVLAGVVWLEHRRHQADEQAYEDELNQQFGGHSETTDPEATTLLPLPPEDLVGPIIGDADPPSATTAGAETGSVRAQNVPGADTVRSGDAAVSRLTPAQRRRAVKKGRIPRDLPGLVTQGPVLTPADEAGIDAADPGPAGQLNLPSPDGSSSDPVAVAAARGYRAGEFHPHHERIPPPLEVWDPMMRAWMPVFPTLLESARHEAHFRQWETEVGSLIDGAYAWLETAA